MKPFNLELAKQGHPLQTRDGCKVTEFHRFETVATPHHQPCVYVVDGELHTCNDQGRYRIGDDEHDLFLAPTEVTMWANVMETPLGQYVMSSALYATKDEAESRRYELHIATVPVTIPTWKP